MKTLLLSAEDIQKLKTHFHEPKTVVQLLGNSCVSNPTTTNHSTSMSLQYYLKQTCSAATTETTAIAERAHQQLLAQSQSQLKQLQLKQHNYHHHPYYQQNSSTITATAKATTATQQQNHAHNQQQYTIHIPINNNNQTHSQPSSHTITPNNNHNNKNYHQHLLNHNSNISAASSSTGGNTSSSQAATHLSNTITSKVFMSGGKARVVTATSSSGSSSSAGKSNSSSNGVLRVSPAAAIKKVKTEPVLSHFHQTERLTFAKMHMGWGEEHWKRVVFQDERKFNLDGPDGFSYYFHDLRNYERSLSQRPRGSSVFVYVMITAGGPIHIAVSMSKQKPESCIDTLLSQRSNILNKLGGNTDVVLQDHNCFVNLLPTVQERLNNEGIKTQKWPTVSHDLNIMENIWGWLIREVYDGGRKFPRKDDLVFSINDVWSRLPMDLITNLYSTLPNRISELYYTRGIYTNC